LAQHRLTVTTNNNSLGVTEYSCYVKATLALDIHEEGIWGWNKSFEFVLPLFEFSRWIQQINIVLKNLKKIKIRNQN
jgi:hypothetical protein